MTLAADVCWQRVVGLHSLEVCVRMRAGCLCKVWEIPVEFLMIAFGTDDFAFDPSQTLEACVVTCVAASS